MTCLLALFFEPQNPLPLRLAANREEYFNRPGLPPQFDKGPPAVICGRDQQAGGTWLGVNQHGLVVGVTNRPLRQARTPQRSRGLLCRDLLDCRDTAAAAELARRELESARYDGCNLLCADKASATWIGGGDEVVVQVLAPGLHVLANGDLNDPHDRRLQRVRALWSATTVHTAAEFRACSRTILSTGAGPDGEPPILLRGADRGTVSSSLITLGAKRDDVHFWFAPGPPDRTNFEDYSEVLRAVLAADEYRGTR